MWLQVFGYFRGGAMCGARLHLRAYHPPAMSTPGYDVRHDLISYSGSYSVLLSRSQGLLQRFITIWCYENGESAAQQFKDVWSWCFLRLFILSFNSHSVWSIRREYFWFRALFVSCSYSAPISVDVEYTRGKEVIVRKGKDGKQGVCFFCGLITATESDSGFFDSALFRFLLCTFLNETQLGSRIPLWVGFPPCRRRDLVRGPSSHLKEWRMEPCWWPYIAMAALGVTLISKECITLKNTSI